MNGMHFRWVVVRNSNHFGIAGWYAQYAMEMGMVVR